MYLAPELYLIKSPNLTFNITSEYLRRIISLVDNDLALSTPATHSGYPSSSEIDAMIKETLKESFNKKKDTFRFFQINVTEKPQLPSGEKFYARQLELPQKIGV